MPCSGLILITSTEHLDIFEMMRFKHLKEFISLEAIIYTAS